MNSVRRTFFRSLLLAVATLAAPIPGSAQGPMPENGATLFPGGALVSWGSGFVTQTPRRGITFATAPDGARPTFAHEGVFSFAWGFRRDYTLTAELPFATSRFDAGGPAAGETGVGDVRLLLKRRFLRRDSERGTTQAAFTIGPKLPTGRSNGRTTGGGLPMGLEVGSGSTDVVLGLGATYTGLFHIKRLVADGTLQHLLRTEGKDDVRLGDETEARFWVSYRPYQSTSVGREWFIGPSLTWQRVARDRRGGLRVDPSGSRVLWLGVTTYASPRAGLVFWFAVEFPVSESLRLPLDPGPRYRFGATRQFPFHR